MRILIFTPYTRHELTWAAIAMAEAWELLGCRVKLLPTLACKLPVHPVWDRRILYRRKFSDSSQVLADADLLVFFAPPTPKWLQACQSRGCPRLLIYTPDASLTDKVLSWYQGVLVADDLQAAALAARHPNVAYTPFSYFDPILPILPKDGCDVLLPYFDGFDRGLAAETSPKSPPLLLSLLTLLLGQSAARVTLASDRPLEPASRIWAKQLKNRFGERFTYTETCTRGLSLANLGSQFVGLMAESAGLVRVARDGGQHGRGRELFAHFSQQHAFAMHAIEHNYNGLIFGPTACQDDVFQYDSSQLMAQLLGIVNDSARFALLHARVQAGLTARNFQFQRILRRLAEEPLVSSKG